MRTATSARSEPTLGVVALEDLDNLDAASYPSRSSRCWSSAGSPDTRARILDRLRRRDADRADRVRSGAVAREPEEGVSRQVFMGLLVDASHRIAQILIGVACLPFRKGFSLTAIARTYWRVHVSKRHLLQWTVSSATQGESRGLGHTIAVMWIAPVIAIFVAFALVGRATLGYAIPWSSRRTAGRSVRCRRAATDQRRGADHDRGGGEEREDLDRGVGAAQQPVRVGGRGEARALGRLVEAEARRREDEPAERGRRRDRGAGASPRSSSPATAASGAGGRRARRGGGRRRCAAWRRSPRPGPPSPRRSGADRRAGRAPAPGAPGGRSRDRPHGAQALHAGVDDPVDHRGAAPRAPEPPR